MNENVENFVAELEKSLANATFLKLVLSNYRGSDRSLQRISVRPIEIKTGSRMMFQTRFETRDIVKNYPFSEGVDEVRGLLKTGFRNAHLFTTERDFQLEIGKRSTRLKAGKPIKTARPSAPHDREKMTLIDPNAFYLKALGIATDKGEIKPTQRDKWRQINKFVEILAGLVEASPIKDKQGLKIVDMGSGKGYLTFAAYDYFANKRSKHPSEPGAIATGFLRPASGSPVAIAPGSDKIEMTGVEARPELVALCNDIAQAGGFEGLKFVQGQIADFDVNKIDILIALHACDTATDDAISKGIKASASIIVAAPCCHKELRRQVKPPEMLAGILKHGVMLERTCETITDGLRSLILEREGYSTKLFEFVPTEHTPKNNMLVAVRQAKRLRSEAAAKQIEEIKSSFGIREQRLEKLLGS